MKRAFALGAVIASVLFASGCSGGGGGNDEISGPILDANVLDAIAIDQFFINGGVEDEYLGQGEFSVYLRDVGTGKDLACSSQADGMAPLASAGVYYGHLSIPLQEVSADHPSSAVRFKLLFVEQDSAGCPEAIGAEDIIVGESAEFSFDSMLNAPIWSTNGKAVALLRQSSVDAGSVTAMAPARTNGLAIDKLYFEYDVPTGVTPRFYLFADRVDDGQTTYQCQIDDASMTAIRSGGILFSALGFPFTCFDLSDPAIANVNVRIGLYVQGNSGPELVGQTEPKTIGALVGERVDFEDGNGYVTFQRVNPKLFGSSVVRLSDLTGITIESLEIAKAASSDSPIELHAVSANSGLSVACAGEAQGLVGVETAGMHEGLAAWMIPVDGQKELFGWDKVELKLIQRTDGRSCPWPLESAPTVLAATSDLAAVDLATGTATFAAQAGSVSFVEAAAEIK